MGFQGILGFMGLYGISRGFMGFQGIFWVSSEFLGFHGIFFLKKFTGFFRSELPLANDLTEEIQRIKTMLMNNIFTCRNYIGDDASVKTDNPTDAVLSIPDVGNIKDVKRLSDGDNEERGNPTDDTIAEEPFRRSWVTRVTGVLK